MPIAREVIENLGAGLYFVLKGCKDEPLFVFAGMHVRFCIPVRKIKFLGLFVIVVVIVRAFRMPFSNSGTPSNR